MILDRFGVTKVNRVSYVFLVADIQCNGFRKWFRQHLWCRILLVPLRRPAFRQVRRPPVTGFRVRSGRWRRLSSMPRQNSSNVIGVPLVALVVVHFGWRWDSVSQVY